MCDRHRRARAAELDEGREEVIADIAARADGAGMTERPRAAPLFAHLLGYRADIERVVRASSDRLTCSDPALRGLIATQNQLGAQLTATMVDIDRWLCTLMDPAQRTFELKELIARHGWPEVDLREIEMDEL